MWALSDHWWPMIIKIFFTHVCATKYSGNKIMFYEMWLLLSKYELKSEVKLCGHLVCLNRYYKTNHKEKYKNLTFYKSTHPGREQSRPALRFCEISPKKSKQ